MRSTANEFDAGQLVHDWNEAGPHRFHRPRRRIELQDETLREGLQSASVDDRSLDAKLALVHLMERLRIDSASFGIPVASARTRETAERLCREISEGRLRLRPNLGGRTVVDDVRPIAEIAQRVGLPIEACLFIGSSPLRQYVEDWSIELLVERTREAVAFATAEGLPVTFITEDTTRSTPEHLRALITAAIDAGARRICLCDTVGCSTPDGTRNLVGWVRGLLEQASSDVEIDWHGHQDRGLGLANALAAIEAGAGRIHATALGLGERVGNTSMEQLLVNLKLLGLRDDDLSAIPDYVEQAAGLGMPIATNAPVVGRDAFRTATGVHAAALAKARRKGDDRLAERVYSAVPASWVGRRNEILVGPMSGAVNVREALRGSDVVADDALIARVLERAKRAGHVLDREQTIEIATSERGDEPLAGNYFVSNYPPFSCWDADGAAAFREALDTPDASSPETPLGLYVHIPFCVQRCEYCYYLSYEGRSTEVAPYLDAVVRETQALASAPAVAGRDLSFVYFGGGTPSILTAEEIADLFGRLQAALPWTAAREVSFECAPRSVNAPKLRALREAGVTRLSLGVQQLDDDVLAASGRVHEVRDVLRAWEAIDEVGFDVTNLDLIVGLPGETDGSFERGLEQVIGMRPDAVTIYQLEIPLNTPLYRKIGDGSGQAPASWAVKRERLRRGYERLEAAGYSVRSAYMAVRDAERHRFVYQDEQYRGADLLGAGVSSFSHVAGVNAQNIASVGPYRQAVEAGRSASWRGHALDADERATRELVLGLKLGQVDKAWFRQRHGQDAWARFAPVIAELASRGFLEDRHDAVVLTREGLLRVDRLLPRFYEPRHRGIRYS